MALFFVFEPGECVDIIFPTLFFFIRAHDIKAIALACDCLDIVVVENKWLAAVFYGIRIKHQQSVIAQQSAAIN